MYGARSSKARKYVYSDQVRFLSKLIYERQTADSSSMDNMEESQVTKLNEMAMIWIISPKKLLSCYLIIRYFKSTHKHHLPDCNSQHIYKLNAVPLFTGTTLKTLLQSTLQFVEKWKWHLKIIKNLFALSQWIIPRIHPTVCKRQRIHPFLNYWMKPMQPVTSMLTTVQQEQSNNWTTIHRRSLCMHDCLVTTFSVVRPAG